MMVTISDVELTRVLLAVTLLLLTTHVLGFVFMRFSMPRVIGEICAGVLLGPTVFGYFCPDLCHWIFAGVANQDKYMGMLGWFGLIFMMVISGFEIDKKVESSEIKIVLSLLIFGTILPFMCGWGAFTLWDFMPYSGPNGNPTSIKIIIAVAVAITSIPVISRIFLDLNIIQTKFARVVLATATIHDLILWIVLAIAAMVAGTQTLSLFAVFKMALSTIGVFLISLFVFPRIFIKLSQTRYNWLLRSSSMGFILFICFIFVVVCSLLHVNAVFGAFLGGIIVGRMPGEVFNEQKQHLKEMAMGFFVPLYFGLVGLKLNLVTGFNPVFCLQFILFAITVSMAANLIGAFVVQRNVLANFNLAFAMNARGGPGIVVASLAYEWGIINNAFFTTLVILALVTSAMAGGWFKFVLDRRWPLLD
jgi:Kef-type K+ transport system membrane component KefB